MGTKTFLTVAITVLGTFMIFVINGVWAGLYEMFPIIPEPTLMKSLYVTAILTALIALIGMRNKK